MDNGGYSIGWIAPLPLELTAAMAMLDEVYGDIHVDGYIFHGARIGQHNIVLGVQPRTGTDAASDLAARMRAAFQHIKYFLVVGVGGGVPSYGRSSAKSQIVLGDVVVSYPRGYYGGVVRYDFGAWADDGRLEFKGHTNGPPGSLLNAVNALQTRHSMSGTKIPDLLQEMRLRIHVDSRRKFEDQGGENDKLFDDDYRHFDSSRKEDCEDCCNQSRSKERHLRGAGASRERDTPRIHYGNIASSNQLQISASKRRQIQEEFDVICFEMEGAGVIQTHPALVIRGICDYSDSHKNKKWQPYAAATAAAYAKELIQVLPESNFGLIYAVDGLSKKPGEWAAGDGSKSKLLMTARQADLGWFYKAFDTELQEVNYDFHSCGCPNHNDDEFLMGFMNSSVFQSWLSQGGSNLWCRLGPDEKVHRTPGACLVRQAVISLSQQVYVVRYKCREAVHINLPNDYRQLKEKLSSNRNEQLDGNESHARQDLIEVILLSFLMQGMQYGLRVKLESLDMSLPRLFLSSLIAAFTETLMSQSCRVIVVVDNLELAGEQELAAVIGALTSIIAHDQSNQCSVMLASEGSTTISLLLRGYPMVHSSSEYQECLQSLYIKDRNVRRSEVTEAIRQSNSWIWSHLAFRNLMSQKSSALAIVGKAGSGKSVLAKTIQRGILARCSSSQNLVAADWFYCRRKGSAFTTYSSLLTSILYEFLARAKSVVFDSYKAIYRRHAPTHARTWTTLELEEVLKCLAQSSVPLFMVFDAIDEAHDFHTIPLVESLVSESRSEVKIIILSRPMLQLQTSFWSSRRIILQCENSGDLQEVIHDGLLKLHKIMLGDHDATEPAPLFAVQRHAALSPGQSYETESVQDDIGVREVAAEDRFPMLDEYDATEPAPSFTVQRHASLSPGQSYETESVQDDIGVREVAAKNRFSVLETGLRQRSNGVILWLVLIFESLYKFVKSEITVSVAELTSYIGHFPLEIEPVYTHMVEELSSRLSVNGLRKARTALMWINVASQTKQFTLSELWDALAIPETSPAEAGAHPIISRREAIRNWEDFHRKIQAMCGSFIEILPDQVIHGTGNSGSFNVSGNSVVQLMHRTAKDFLTSSHGAATLSFTEEEAFDLVSIRTMDYMNLVFPHEQGISKPAGTFSNSNWRDYLSHVAFYLDEFRLIEFCRQFCEAQPTRLSDLQPQSQMIWNGFLNNRISDPTESIAESAFAGWRYDVLSQAPTERVSSALGYVFQFSTALGLKSAVYNILSLSKLQDEVAFWDIYHDAILNGVLFTVLDQKNHPSYPKFRRKLISPSFKFEQRDSAVLAIDHLYDMSRGSEIHMLHAPHSSIDIRNVYDAVEMVLKYVTSVEGIYKWNR